MQGDCLELMKGVPDKSVDIVNREVRINMNKHTNSHLNKAKEKKDDEFYTIYDDVESELKNYKDKLKDKIVYLNCDNPEYSNFWKYFVNEFYSFGLKGLYSTYYNENSNSKVSYYDGEKVTKKDLLGNGDFRSSESVEIMKKSDVIITNPPFSLLKEHIGQLLENNKDMIVLGNINAVTYASIFPSIRDSVLRSGFNFNISCDFYTDSDGKNKRKVSGIAWFTTLNIDTKNKRNYNMTYEDTQYRKYDNYDAIDIPKLNLLPYNYDGVMGVPVTYIGIHDDSQYKILGSNRGRKQDSTGYFGRSTYINGKETYKRVFIKKR